jgi:hypothetical protein
VRTGCNVHRRREQRETETKNERGIRSRTDVLAVQPRGVDGADEELAPVRAGAGVGHGQDALPDVRQLKVLVRELGAVNALAPGAFSVSL